MDDFFAYEKITFFTIAFHGWNSCHFLAIETYHMELDKTIRKPKKAKESQEKRCVLFCDI